MKRLITKLERLPPAKFDLSGRQSRYLEANRIFCEIDSRLKQHPAYVEQAGEGQIVSVTSRRICERAGPIWLEFPATIGEGIPDNVILSTPQQQILFFGALSSILSQSQLQRLANKVGGEDGIKFKRLIDICRILLFDDIPHLPLARRFKTVYSTAGVGKSFVLTEIMIILEQLNAPFVYTAPPRHHPSFTPRVAPPLGDVNVDRPLALIYDPFADDSVVKIVHADDHIPQVARLNNQTIFLQERLDSDFNNGVDIAVRRDADDDMREHFGLPCLNILRFSPAVSGVSASPPSKTAGNDPLLNYYGVYPHIYSPSTHNMLLGIAQYRLGSNFDTILNMDFDFDFGGGDVVVDGDGDGDGDGDDNNHTKSLKSFDPHLLQQLQQGQQHAIRYAAEHAASADNNMAVEEVGLSFFNTSKDIACSWPCWSCWRKREPKKLRSC